MACCWLLQVRPNDVIMFKQLNIEDAYKACFLTDALIEVVKQLATGQASEEEGHKKLTSFQVCAIHLYNMVLYATHQLS